jgi:hypothetical protein
MNIGIVGTIRVARIDAGHIDDAVVFAGSRIDSARSGATEAD